MAEEASDQQLRVSRRRYFSGTSLEQALVAAGSEFGISPSEVAYRRFEKRHGFLRTPKKILIEVDPDNPRRQPEEIAADGARAGGKSVEKAAVRGEASGEVVRARTSAAPPADVPSKAPKLPQEKGAGQTSSRGAIERLVAVMGLQLSFELAEADSGGELAVVVTLDGPDAELVLREHGKALYSLEHLVPRVAVSGDEGRFPCEVDCRGFKAARLQELESIARSAAEEVLATGKVRTLELLNPAERRVVHMTLADVSGVDTNSEGDGYLKYLTISPVRGMAPPTQR